MVFVRQRALVRISKRFARLTLHETKHFLCAEVPSYNMTVSAVGCGVCLGVTRGRDM